MVALDELTTEQKESLQQLRNNLEELLSTKHDDEYLLRFLVARKFDVSAATNMLRKHLQYWKRYDLNKNWEECEFEKKSLYFFSAMLGFTNDGSLVRLVKMGQTDIKGLILSHTKYEAFSVLVNLMEKDRIAQKQRTQKFEDGKDGKMCYIIDLKGLPWRLLFYKPVGRYTSYMLGMYEANYPECLKTVYIVNAPGFFSIIYSFLKKILPSEIVSKIVILRSGEVASVLSEIMDLSLLPVDLGGSRSDPDGDPSCSSLFPVKPGTSVPQEFYLATQDNSLEKDPTAKKAVILNQSTFSIPFSVQVPNSVLAWDFRTSDKDVAMGLLYKKNVEAKAEVMIRVHKVDSHKYTESGRYICEEPGTYELFFDNTYSWFSKKELIYKASVLTPMEEEEACSEIMQNLSIKISD